MKSMIVFWGKFPSDGEVLKAMRTSDELGYAWEDIHVPGSGDLEPLFSIFGEKALFLFGEGTPISQIFNQGWAEEGEFGNIQIFKKKGDPKSPILFLFRDLSYIPNQFDPFLLSFEGRIFGKTLFLFPQIGSSILEDLTEEVGKFQALQIKSHTLIHFLFEGEKGDAQGYFREILFRIPQFLERKLDLLFIGEKFLWMHIGEELLKRRNKVGVAESLTGGLISQLLTETPGASNYFHQGLVTYRTESKAQTLGIGKEIEEGGVISEKVSLAMARKARELSRADFGIGITGLAGPGGGSDKIPVGTVFISLVGREREKFRKLNLKGDRQEIRLQSACWALLLLRSLLEESDF